MAVELGTGYVSLTASAKGLAKSISDEISEPISSAASKSGDEAGESFMGRFGKAGAAAAIGVGVLIGGTIAKGVSEAMSLEVTNDKLAAQLGLPPDRAAELGKAAGALYGNNYGESVAQVSDTIRGLFQGGLLPEDATNEQIERIGAKTLDLTSAFGQDQQAIINAAGQLIRTGLATDVDQAIDLITRGFQQGVDKSGDFLDTLNEYGTQFRKLGFEGDLAIGLIRQGLQAGARDGDLVADALKEFSIRAIDGSEATAEALGKLNLTSGVKDYTDALAMGGDVAKSAFSDILASLKSVEDPAERAKIAVALFGTQAEDLGDALYALDPSTAAEGLGQIEGAAEQLGNTLNDNLASKLESLRRKGLMALASFANGVVLPALTKLGAVVTPIAAEISGGVKAFVAAFKDGGDEVASSGFAGILEQIGVTARNVFDKIREIDFGAIFSGAAAFMAPVAAALIGVGTAVADLVVKVVEFAVSAWPSVKSAIELAAPVIASMVTTIKDGLVAAVNLLNPILGFLGSHLKEIALVLGPLVAVFVAYQVATAALSVVQAAITLVTQGYAAAQALLNAVMSANPIGLVVIALAALAGGLLLAYNKSETFRDIVDAVGRFLRDKLWPAIQTVAEAIGGFLVDSFNRAKAIIEAVWPVIQRVVEVLGTALKFAIDIAVAAITGIINWFAFLINAAVNVHSGITSAFDQVVGFITGMPGRIASAASGMFDGIKDAFRSAVNFIIDGWNNLSFTLPSIDTKIPGVGKVGGFTINTPNIPRLARGGVITEPTVALLGETTRAQPEIVSPARMLRDIFRSELDVGGRSAVFHQVFNGTNLSARDVADEMAWTLKTAGV